MQTSQHMHIFVELALCDQYYFLLQMDGGERAKKPILSEMTSHSVTSDILDDKVNI